MTDNIINLKDRLETIKCGKTVDNISKVCAAISEDAESYKRAIIIVETNDGEIFSSWCGIYSTGHIYNLIESALSRFFKTVNNVVNKKCEHCNGEMIIQTPYIHKSRFQCYSRKCKASK